MPPDGAILALDAMGVLYATGDDVGDLLVPFAHDKGSSAVAAEIEQAYLAASLGQIDAEEFWWQIGLDPRLEDDYLRRHRLADGVREFLAAAGTVFGTVCCISNDVSRWSAKLRRSFAIEASISPWLVSGDLGIRKPDERIYRQAIARLGVPASRLYFVDDRVKNLDAARQLGINTILFDPTGMATETPHLSIRRLGDLLDPRVLALAINDASL